MCYTMHIGAVDALKLRADRRADREVHRPLKSGKIGTLSYSDPETGSHFWYPIASGAGAANGGYKVREEGLMDDLGRICRLLRRADHEPDYSGYETCRCS